MTLALSIPEPPDVDLFVESYLDDFALVMSRVPTKQLIAANAALLSAFESGSWVFVAGNGGSASLASHFACDLEKTTSGKSPRSVSKRFQVMSLVDNVASVTAWANDETYDCIFAERLRGRARPGDVLVVISASGNSPNIVEALEAAQDLGMVTIGWLGFDGGRAKELCDIPVHFESSDYGLVESAHAVIAHLMTSWLTKAAARVRQLEAAGHGKDRS